MHRMEIVLFYDRLPSDSIIYSATLTVIILLLVLQGLSIINQFCWFIYFNFTYALFIILIIYRK